jgi:AraC-like DNA-binding protein
MAESRWHVAFLGASAMDYEEAPPPRGLEPWIAVSWRMRAREPFELRILPDGCMDIIGTDVVGSLTVPIVVPFAEDETASGIRFHPGGLPALLGVPASELVDLTVPVDELVRGRFSLSKLAADADRPDPVAVAAYTAQDLLELRQETGYSERQLRRRVHTAAGHSPKRLMRIGRMQRVLRAGRRGTWAATANEHGFFDEAHMVNDVRDLAGVTPSALVAAMAGSSKPRTGDMVSTGQHEG